MKLFNIGIPEALLLVIFIFIILGPGRIVSSARSLGIWLRKISKSQLWHDLVSTSNEIKDLPQKIIKEAELDEEMESLKELSRENSILPGNYLKETQEETDTTLEDENIR
jgi:Sec-independent protein translocase protein TatA